VAGLALRMEEAMPPKGEPREWRVLDITKRTSKRSANS
jgi:hypothetical protein